MSKEDQERWRDMTRGTNWVAQYLTSNQLELNDKNLRKAWRLYQEDSGYVFGFPQPQKRKPRLTAKDIIMLREMKIGL